MDRQGSFCLHTSEGIADLTAIDVSVIRLSLVDHKSCNLFLIAHLILGTLPHLLLATEPDGKTQYSKSTYRSGLHLGRSEVLRSLRHYLWAHSQGKETKPLIT